MSGIGGGLRSPRAIVASRMLATTGLADHLGGGPEAEEIAARAVERAEAEIRELGRG
ncbi:hypothetical protein SEA_KLEVEY_50 [Arthrobacter phage Klevey]|uniref:Uncharacterized protein n=1 Tax=Arthrobacter phage Klevey TaxID=2867481 RepID=A0AAE8XNQ4_9CAUD|nr:hypothetical protein SEA_KLEVEY_50 [Arthrobacter phage Klevey]